MGNISMVLEYKTRWLLWHYLRRVFEARFSTTSCAIVATIFSSCHRGSVSGLENFFESWLLWWIKLLMYGSFSYCICLLNGDVMFMTSFFQSILHKLILTKHKNQQTTEQATQSSCSFLSILVTSVWYQFWKTYRQVIYAKILTRTRFLSTHNTLVF